MSHVVIRGQRLFVDGVEMRHVRGFELVQYAPTMDSPVLRVELYVDDLDVDVQGDVIERPRLVAKLTDFEALERALQLLGENAAPKFIALAREALAAATNLSNAGET